MSANSIHPTALIDPKARIGEEVSIGAYTVIGPEVSIGDGTEIGSHTLIEGATRIGKKNRIFSHAVIGSIPQDLKYHGEKVRLEIGDENIIREFTLINPGTEGGGGVTRIGNGNLLMGYVHIAHDVRIGDRCILANAATLAGHVELGDHVVVGGMTPIHQFVRIGDYAMIAGASALSQDIPPYCLAEGNRAHLRGLNLTGLRRKMERETIDALKQAYRELFESGKPLKETAQSLRKSTEHPAVANLCRFILESQRGIPFKRKQ
ncbi:acyl-ACP--UDP-N-acetylglucosamine O-acyltransferase [Nitratifractor salsuginis]|uniref:Acyl-[acyl-carrier-protein]--UDP-N-acetylglucosamine O-acyltransferase n=1 Tax=Nitratifractor salsuginis (strain DSM 16511 / JCM 12458 / E9I37-1) TaxID=749222 RepID=E6WYF9_NITSE|nr:acyl-ACP--UDP-N-acetylglucosamine O-acyltransferase [Nitratifractor salsuginis]ADV46471.1 acyl-(acyl-carrier-protein)--UDP-N-acetylglucosamine O-acyltransferase [Nitratifractor salsuginis DSM 16511]